MSWFGFLFNAIEWKPKIFDFFYKGKIWVLRRFLWSKGKLATEKENLGPVFFEASEASGLGLYFGIDPFREGVGDIADEIGRNVG